MSRFRTIEISDSSFENDGLKFLTVKSKNLKGRGDICVFVPDNAAAYSSLPIYILLHGVYGSAWSWALKGGAHITAKRLMIDGSIKPAIIVMPSDGLWGDGSAYLAHNQRDFSQWIISDVPQLIHEVFSFTDNSSPLCLSGLSMGGYGALHLGVDNPSKVAAISAHSAITNFKGMANFVEEPLSLYNLKTKQNDVLDLCIKNKRHLPPLRFDCGTEDPLLEANRTLHQELNNHNIPHTYLEFKGGHEWPYWQRHIEDSFLFFDKTVSNNNL